LIAQLRGTVARTAGSAVVLDVNGVGYKVNVPVSVLQTLPAEPDKAVTLVTATLVREDDISLYGFANEQELAAFELLLTVSGIGPKAALTLLSAMTAGDVARAVSSGDVRTLTRVPGVGPKTAQRMVLELKEKFAQLGFETKVQQLAAGEQVRQRDSMETTADEVISALMNLGYNKAEAQRATSAALEERTKADPANPPKFADLLRAALNRLTKA
jgi:Holliday junction DNA helicase RuvA